MGSLYDRYKDPSSADNDNDHDEDNRTDSATSSPVLVMWPLYSKVLQCVDRAVGV